MATSGSTTWREGYLVRGQPPPGNTFTIGLIGDPHISSEDSERNRINLGRLKYILEVFREKRPLFVAVLGDLTNGHKTEVDLAYYYLTMEKFMRETGVPVFSIPGNHDIGDFFALRYLGWHDRTADYVAFIDDYQYVGAHGYFDYSITVGNYTFLFLDNVQKPRDEWQWEKYAEVTDDQLTKIRGWISDASNAGREIYSFSHISPMHILGYPLNGTSQLFDLLYNNALASFNGHEHQPSTTDPEHSEKIGAVYSTSPMEWYALDAVTGDVGFRGGFAELVVHKWPRCGYRVLRTQWLEDGTLQGAKIVYQGRTIDSPETITGFRYYDEVPMDVVSPITVEGPNGHLKLEAHGKQAITGRLISRNGGKITISGHYCPPW